MNIEKFYKLAEEKEIYITRVKLESSKGYYINHENNCIILLNKILSNIEEKMTLAEELGHHFKGVIPNCPFSTDYYNKLIRSKNEFKAFTWYQNKLVPPNIENKLIDTDNTIYEVAEEISVPVDFLDKVLQYRKENLYEGKYY